MFAVCVPADADPTAGDHDVCTVCLWVIDKNTNTQCTSGILTYLLSVYIM